MQLALVGKTGGDYVFSYVTGSVCSRTVYFSWILAGEGAAAVARIAAVRVDDNFTTGETGVSLRSTDDETAGRVYKVARLVV